MSSPGAPASSPQPVVPVAAAVIVHRDGRFLLAQRPAGKVYAGYWEFPGGKIEPAEAPLQALARELQEELGISVERAYPWITRRYTYEHATVDLHFFRVTEFRGEPHGRESQRLAWQRLDRIDVEPILPANGPILAALRLPPVYAITDATERGPGPALHALERALARGLSMVQVREPRLAPDALLQFGHEVTRRAHAAGAKVLVNADVELARACGANGVHLKAAQLTTLSQRPPFELVAASCHDDAELRQASGLGVDFVVLGPVAPTRSHPGAPPLGMRRFAELIRGYPLPAYALGGMQPADLRAAWEAGAHGIAMQRAAWEEA